MTLLVDALYPSVAPHLCLPWLCPCVSMCVRVCSCACMCAYISLKGHMCPLVHVCLLLSLQPLRACPPGPPLSDALRETPGSSAEGGGQAGDTPRSSSARLCIGSALAPCSTGRASPSGHAGRQNNEAWLQTRSSAPCQGPGAPCPHHRFPWGCTCRLRVVPAAPVCDPESDQQREGAADHLLLASALPHTGPKQRPKDLPQLLAGPPGVRICRRCWRFRRWPRCK